MVNDWTHSCTTSTVCTLYMTAPDWKNKIFYIRAIYRNLLVQKTLKDLEGFHRILQMQWVRMGSLKFAEICF